jgi:hypothetical protein
LVKEKTPGNLFAEALIIILETFLQSEEIENLVVTESAAGVRCAAVRHVLREERRSSLENVGGRRPSLLLCRNGRRGSTLSAAEASAAASGNGNGKSSPRCSVDGTAAIAAGGIKRRKSLYETAVSGAEEERRWDGGDIGVMEVETSAREDEQSPGGQDTSQGKLAPINRIHCYKGRHSFVAGRVLQLAPSTRAIITLITLIHEGVTIADQ